MAKSIFKEIIIVLLLILAVLILLAVLFYDYIPNSKVVPAKVESYALENDVKLELEKELNNSNSEEVIKTYQLDAIDLEQYEKTKEYNKGKVNPFAEYSTGTTTTSGGTSTGSGNTQTGTNSSGNSGNKGTNNSNGSANSNNNTNNNNNNESTGTFLNTVGK